MNIYKLDRLSLSVRRTFNSDWKQKSWFSSALSYKYNIQTSVKQREATWSTLASCSTKTKTIQLWCWTQTFADWFATIATTTIQCFWSPPVVVPEFVSIFFYYFVVAAVCTLRYCLLLCFSLSKTGWSRARAQQNGMPSRIRGRWCAVYDSYPFAQSASSSVSNVAVYCRLVWDIYLSGDARLSLLFIFFFYMLSWNFPSIQANLMFVATGGKL